MKYTKKAVGYNCMRTVRHINPVVYFLTTKVLSKKSIDKVLAAYN